MVCVLWSFGIKDELGWAGMPNRFAHLTRPDNSNSLSHIILHL